MRQSLRNAIVYWLPCFAWMALIYWLSSRSSFDGPKWLSRIYGYDKLLHAVLYGGLAGTFFRLAAHLYPRMPVPSLVLLTVLGAVAFGVTDELHQVFVPNRDADVWDLLADAGGALLVTSLLGVIYVRRREHRYGSPSPAIYPEQ